MNIKEFIQQYQKLSLTTWTMIVGPILCILYGVALCRASALSSGFITYSVISFAFLGFFPTVASVRVNVVIAVLFLLSFLMSNIEIAILFHRHPEVLSNIGDEMPDKIALGTLGVERTTVMMTAIWIVFTFIGVIKRWWSLIGSIIIVVSGGFVCLIGAIVGSSTWTPSDIHTECTASLQSYAKLAFILSVPLAVAALSMLLVFPKNKDDKKI